jgi:hypothetical protein
MADTSQIVTKHHAIMSVLPLSAQSMQWLQDPDNDVYHKAVEMTKKVTFAF